jgi:hypothetical protein
MLIITHQAAVLNCKVKTGIHGDPLYIIPVCIYCTYNLHIVREYCSRLISKRLYFIDDKQNRRNSTIKLFDYAGGISGLFLVGHAANSGQRAIIYLINKQ